MISKKVVYSFTIFLLLLFIVSCDDDMDGMGGEVEIPDFNMPITVNFQDSLSAYSIFQGEPSDLLQNEDYHLLELSSVLFTDYAHKQRLVKVPDNFELTRLNDGSIEFPDSTILVKTFYYYNDERNQNLGKRIIETRLMIKSDGFWNVATYIWNDSQTDAILQLNGLDIQVDWIDDTGINRSTLYDVPDENECITCHQSNNSIIPLGTTLTNLNRNVSRNGQTINLLNHLQVVGILNDFDIQEVAEIPNYNDNSYSLEERARAYMHMNCSHCHNPNGWEEAVEQDLDFRYTTNLNASGILMESDEIEEMVQDGEMPFIGTTLLDDQGVELIIEYINSL